MGGTNIGRLIVRKVPALKVAPLIMEQAVTAQLVEVGS
jgi:hypothetical protein